MTTCTRAEPHKDVVLDSKNVAPNWAPPANCAMFSSRVGLMPPVGKRGVSGAATAAAATPKIYRGADLQTARGSMVR